MIVDSVLKITYYILCFNTCSYSDYDVLCTFCLTITYVSLGCNECMVLVDPISCLVQVNYGQSRANSWQQVMAMMATWRKFPTLICIVIFCLYIAYARVNFDLRCSCGMRVCRWSYSRKSNLLSTLAVSAGNERFLTSGG